MAKRNMASRSASVRLKINFLHFGKKLNIYLYRILILPPESLFPLNALRCILKTEGAVRYASSGGIIWE